MPQPLQKTKPTLALGPMSTEIIEAVFNYSHFHRKELMLIASKNQIDHSGGYVNRWTTKEYMTFVKGLKKKYPNAKVKVCRDHCGPGFNGNHDIKDVYKTIDTDIKNGFDLIHVDFCHFKGTADERIKATKKAILRCLKLNPKIEIEIGTDENEGTTYGLHNIKEWEKEIEFFLEFCKPRYYVVQTGSLVMEINQVGDFNKTFVTEISKSIHARGLELKEHNADYLSKEEISNRTGIVDAMNIAPQLGVIQTQTVLARCLIYGIRFDTFLDLVYKGGKWKKWLETNTKENKMLCAVIAGHYHFSSLEYQEIIRQLEKQEDINEIISNAILSVIHHYVTE